MFFQDESLKGTWDDYGIKDMNEFMDVRAKAKFSILHRVEEFRSCDGFFYYKGTWENWLTVIWKQKQSPLAAFKLTSPSSDVEILGKHNDM